MIYRGCDDEALCLPAHVSSLLPICVSSPLHETDCSLLLLYVAHKRSSTLAHTARFIHNLVHKLLPLTSWPVHTYLNQPHPHLPQRRPFHVLVSRLFLSNPAFHVSTSPKGMPSLLRAFTNLTPRTRALIGFGLIAYASIAMYTTDAVAPSLGFDATERDRDEVKRWVPRVSVRERQEVGKQGEAGEG